MNQSPEKRSTALKMTKNSEKQQHFVLAVERANPNPFVTGNFQDLELIACNIDLYQPGTGITLVPDSVIF